MLVASNVPEARGLVLAKRLGITTWAKSHEGMKRARVRRRCSTRRCARTRSRSSRWPAICGCSRPASSTKWEGRILNIHPSLLPLHKGLDTHQRAILAGDEYAGCSVHLVTADLDSGPVLAQAKVKILPRDDADSLAARVLEEEHRLYPLALEDYCRALEASRGDWR